MGDRCVISHYVRILTHDFSLDRVAEERGLLAPDDELYRVAPVLVGTRSFIGLGATLLPGVRIGDGSVVAAGAIVTGDVPAGVVVAGNPARVIKTTAEYLDASLARFETRRRRR